MKDAKGIVVLASLLLLFLLPVAANSKEIVLQGGTLLPISAPPIEDGTIVIKNGKISAIGQNLAVLLDTRVVNAEGKFVMPGLIDAQSRLFVMPAELNENRSIAPELNILDAINPFIKDDSEVSAQGVTTVCIAPGNSSLLGGKIAVLKLNGSKDVDEMLLKGEVAIKAAIGVSSNNESSSLTRLEHYSSIREAFLKAKAYIHEKQKYTRELAEYNRKRAEYDKRKDDGEDGDNSAKVKDKPKRPKRFKPDPTYEVLERVLAKEIPLQIEAHRVTDILNAVRLAHEFGFSLILDKCTEGYKITEEIAQSKAPVIIGPVTTSFASMQKLEHRNHNPRNAAILSKRSIKVALGVSGRDGISSKFILMAAALAVANGMDEDAALRAITLTPAEILGVADRIGSLDVGKDADIVLFSDHPLNSLSQVEMVLIDGEIVYERADQQ
jgi:imidazolonepropionase-like amidohydrolase